jgi:hypothetical protein
MRFAPVLLLAGCTTSMSTLQTARVLDRGQLQFTAALEGSLHSAALAEPLEAADRLAEDLQRAEDTGEVISEAVEREAIEAALALTLFTPSVSPVFVGRVAPIPQASTWPSSAASRTTSTPARHSRRVCSTCSSSSTWRTTRATTCTSA